MIKRIPYCIYCNELKKLSDEHVIADWIKSVIPRMENSHENISSRAIVSNDTTYLIGPVIERNNGNLGTRKLKRVCIECNNGWMSVLQNNIKYPLTEYIKGKWEGFDPDVAQLISTWSTMTTINIDCAEKRGGGIAQEDRFYFYKNKMPPENWSIWLGRCTGSSGISIFHRPIQVAKKGHPFPNGYNSQITTIVLGQLVLHNMSMPKGYMNFDPLEYGRYFGVIPIFPKYEGEILEWRKAPFLTQEEILKLANEFCWSMPRQK